MPISKKPGKYPKGKGYLYFRRQRIGSRTGPVVLHDRRKNPVRKHAWGKDSRELKKLPKMSKRNKK